MRLDNVNITNALLDTLICPKDTTLVVKGSFICSGTYTLKPEDFQSGPTPGSLPIHNTMKAQAGGVQLDQVYAHYQVNIPVQYKPNLQLYVDLVASTCRQVVRRGEHWDACRIRCRVAIAGPVAWEHCICWKVLSAWPWPVLA